MMKSPLAPGVLPLGFKSAGISAKIKKSGKKDIALFYSSVPCVASALFTANTIKAAPLLVSRAHLKKGKIQAVVANSGNANCMTGEQGVRDAQSMAGFLAKELSLKAHRSWFRRQGLSVGLSPCRR